MTAHRVNGRRRGTPRRWLTELRLLLDRAAALNFPTHRSETRRG